MSVLFESVHIGELQLANRVVMAPLTRSRGTGADNRVPNELIATYYSQRAKRASLLLKRLR
jgi:2,4-dienoyl-CoA reductase-like NADH-dependent reductase (Old Yellow Enzyme family)